MTVLQKRQILIQYSTDDIIDNCVLLFRRLKIVHNHSIDSVIDMRMSLKASQYIMFRRTKVQGKTIRETRSWKKDETAKLFCDEFYITLAKNYSYGLQCKSPVLFFSSWFLLYQLLPPLLLFPGEKFKKKNYIYVLNFLILVVMVISSWRWWSLVESRAKL